MTTNLLIGGSGYIGSALAPALAAKGVAVISLAKDAVTAVPGVETVVCDLGRQPCPPEVIGRADNIFILIGQIGPDFNKTEELATLARLAESLKSAKAKIFYFSSALVYGDTKQPADETAPVAPIDDYARYKLEAEAVLTKLIPAERLVVFRLSNIYGARKNRGIIGLVMNELVNEKPSINLNGDGHQQRDFLYRDDLVGAILAVAAKPAASGVVNLSTGRSYSLIEVVELIAKISGRPIAYHVTHRQLNEVKSNLVDNHQLQRVYGFNKFTTFEDGLTATLAAYLSKGSA